MIFNQLNNDCSWLVFKLFSVQEQIQLRIVCQRWKNLIEVSLQSVTTLKLFQHVGEVEEYCKSLIRFSITDDEHFKLCTSAVGHNEVVGHYRDSLWHSNNQDILKHTLYQLSQDRDSGGLFSEENPDYGRNRRMLPLKSNCNFLASLFPNLKKLTVAYSDLNQVDLSFLLKAWTHSLVSLSIFALPSRTRSKFEDILNVINSMPCLIRLDFLFQEQMSNEPYFYCSSRVTLANSLSSVMARLEHFSIYYNFHLESIFHNLGANIRRLMFHHCYLEDLMELNRLKPTLLSSLVDLTISTVATRTTCGVNLNVLQYIAKNFTSLKSLSFMPAFTTKFIDILQTFVSMASLTELKVYYYCNNYVKYNKSWINVIQNDDRPIPQLKSIKVLHLAYAKLLKDPALFFRIIPQAFPNLEVINITEKCAKPEMLKMKKELDKNCSSHFGLSLLEHNFKWVQVQEQAAFFSGTHADNYQKYKRNYNDYIKVYDEATIGHSRYAGKRRRIYD